MEKWGWKFGGEVGQQLQAERAPGQSTSHCGTFRISIALRELIDAHKSVELAPRKGQKIVENRGKAGRAASWGKSRGRTCNSLCMRNHCSRKLENFQLWLRPNGTSRQDFGYNGSWLSIFLHRKKLT